jgi:hypothetical protein
VARKLAIDSRPPQLADGVGRWSCAEIAKRYRAYCGKFRCHARDIDFELAGTLHHELPWIMPVINQVISGIAANDPACIEIGLELIEEDAKFAFGKIMKASAANALRRASLSEAQKERVRARVVSLLARGLVPHEMREYARLMKRIGLGSHGATLGDQLRHWSETGQAAPHAQRFVRYLLDLKLGPRVS